MNLSAKPISSPGRPEKYPPPLMRFLKSNAASKSRGKSRSSPMFIRNKKNNNVIQEPTSPKVTCIGQVRSKARTGKSKPGSNRACSCFRIKKIKRPKRLKMPKDMIFCSKLGNIFVPRWLKPDWSKWVLFFRPGCCRRREVLADSAKIEDVEIEAEKEVEMGVDLGATCPPKNALLLTRCRSAPYRSSTQISRFCPVLEAEEKTGEKTEDFGNGRENGEITKEILEKRDLGLIEKKLVDLGPIEKKLVDLGPIEKKLVDLRLIESILSRKSEEISRKKAQPLVLMRCKSEPAKTGERLNQNLVGN